MPPSGHSLKYSLVQAGKEYIWLRLGGLLGSIQRQFAFGNFTLQMTLEFDAGNKRSGTRTFKPGAGGGSPNQKTRLLLDPAVRPLEGAGVNPLLGKGSQQQGWGGGAPEAVTGPQSEGMTGF